LFNMTRFVIIGLAIAAAAMPVLAVDGGIGRTITGTWVIPGVAVVGPDPGPGLTVLPFGYQGAIGGSRIDPVGGVIVSNDQANASINVVIPSYTWKTETTKVNFSSALMIPANWWGASGSVLANNTFTGTTAANASVGDVIFIPVTIGVHLSENNNLAFSTWVWAPTGLWRSGNLSNVGMGVVTFVPNAGHTFYWEKHKVEFDNFVGFDIYQRNRATDYGSGTMFHWDGMAIKYFGKKRGGIGAVIANQTQITDDSGPLAQTLNGFSGRKWGVGPTVIYTARADNPGVTFQFRWINEFHVTNMLKGNIFMAGVYFKLK
jgi:hypothetical protein